MAITIKKILCPVDFSTPSDEALAFACDLAQRTHAQLHIVHVFQNPVYVLPMSGYIGPQADLLFQMRRRCAETLEQTRSRLEKAGVRVQTEVVEGVAHQEILGCARQAGADLIVIGTHGHTGLAHAVLGSVAERVVRLADRPVLVVPSRGASTSA